MELLTFVPCFLLTLITFYVFILHSSIHKRRQVNSGTYLVQPPGPAGLPFLGNAINFFSLMRHNPHRSLARLAETYGPIVWIHLTNPIVVVSSAATAREALSEKDGVLAARFVPDTVRAMSHNAGSLLFLPSSSPLWKHNRTTVAAHLSTGRSLDKSRPIRDRHARRLAEHLIRACSGQHVKVREVVFGTVLNATSNIFFSRDVADLEGAQVLKDLITPVVVEVSKPNISDAFPFIAPLDLFGSRSRSSKCLARLYKFFDQQFIEPRLASGEYHGDLLDSVLERHAKSQITRSEIPKLFADIFIGGSDTSALTVEWAMAQLLRHPDKMEKLRAEITASLSSKDFVEESDLHKLPYLQAVVKEILRLHPAVPLAPREVVADAVSLGGFPVPKGTRVLVNLWAIGRDPTAWPEPDEFMPERFLGPQALHFRSSDFAYRPFGAGRRVCPGIDLATRFVPLVLASILHKINWRLPDGMVHKDVDLRDKFATVLELATPLHAVPVSTA